MTFVQVPTSEGFEMKNGGSSYNLMTAMLAKEAYIALGDLELHIYLESFLDTANNYYIRHLRWYVLCSEKYPN